VLSSERHRRTEEAGRTDIQKFLCGYSLKPAVSELRQRANATGRSPLENGVAAYGFGHPLTLRKGTYANMTSNGELSSCTRQ
jgi:hypothetical protein